MHTWGTARSDMWSIAATTALLCGSILCFLSLGVYVHKPEDSASHLCHGAHGPATAGLDVPSSEFNEGSIVHGEWTIWPMGLECTWTSRETGRKINYQSGGWALTWVMVTGLSLNAVGIGAALRSKVLRKTE
ncbi:hypothetical protein I6N91_05925 [Arthrobacter sp. MSA 4-2]|uniref:hypothetical protein n=1 Tax=Arthrobacter sp. MSA 4-2 TaxID=2794349 RepID=UPI0018E6EE8D|nr:hypothetical protein [Arthrobacter sp. MSA 4-2]MBJ2120514.1 hypothetical protein [Arthrobacter sp. MSA 4-2]